MGKGTENAVIIDHQADGLHNAGLINAIYSLEWGWPISLV